MNVNYILFSGLFHLEIISSFFDGSKSRISQPYGNHLIRNQE